jgi:hypothetical protein
MTSHVTKLQNEPILLAKVELPIDLAAEVNTIETAVKNALQDSKGLLYYCCDMTEMPMDFHSLVFGMAETFRRPNTVFADARLRIYFVGKADNATLKAAVNAAKQNQYGGVEIQLFNSHDSALEKMRSDIARQN